MKRMLCLMLAVLLLVLICGCSLSQFGKKDNVSFYYPRKEYDFDASDGVISAESRDMAAHASDISYILNMYLLGPLDPNLKTGFPAGTHLKALEYLKSEIIVTLTGESVLSDIDFTLSGICLARTCSEASGISRVTVIRGSQSITFTPDQILFSDPGSGDTQ